METSKLRKFASFARKSLIEQVGTKMKTVLADGSLARRENPKAVADLEAKIADLGKQQTIETVAYTWFNRFCALRYMDVNRYTKIGILSPAEGQFLPEILGEAKAGHLDDEMVPKATREKVLRILDGTDPSNDPQGEAYRLLLVAACNHYHLLMPFLFEKISHFTELLLPDDLLSGTAIPTYTREALLPANCSPEHTEESVEVIGWLYQFYIADKKDDVFAALKKGKKITPENIPAATQLFTPHWIVRYLVENTLGRLWMLNHPESKLVERMDYYIKPEPISASHDKQPPPWQPEWRDAYHIQDGRVEETMWLRPNPALDGKYEEAMHYALSIDGFACQDKRWFGGDLADISRQWEANNFKGCSFQQLRAALFFFQRNARWNEVDPNDDPEDPFWKCYRALCEAWNREWQDHVSDLPKLPASIDAQSPETNQTETVFLRISRPEEVKICDPACGSGHMLTYAFDLLYAIYEEQGYNPTEIPRLILAHNLYGIEIDARAGALAAFALTMKAREKDRRFLSRAPIANPKSLIQNQTIQNPNVCVLENISVDPQELDDYMDKVGRDLFSGGLQGVVNQWEEADNFGSLIRPLVTDVSEVLELLRERQMDEDLFLQETHQKVLRALRQADYLSPKYHVVVANPPYMGKNGMNPSMRALAKDSFPTAKADLYAMFVDHIRCWTVENGQFGLMTPFTWMFLSSFEDLRHEIISNCTITSLVRPEYHSFFDSAYVPICAFVGTVQSLPNYKGTFVDLTKFYGADIQAAKYKEAISSLDCDWVFFASSDDFTKISGTPIAYWVTPVVRQIFSTCSKITEIATPKVGLQTGKNEVFVRNWSEVSSDCFRVGYSRADTDFPTQRWFPCNKGGEFRRWYGNHNEVIDWENDGQRVRANVPSAVIRNPDTYFSEVSAWSRIGTGEFALRLVPNGFVHNDASCYFIASSPELLRVVTGLLNSKVRQKLLEDFSPTITVGPGQLENIPFADKIHENMGRIVEVVESCVALSKADWNSFESSWEFQRSPLVVLAAPTLAQSYDSHRSHAQSAFSELRWLEETNNELFIAAYGLADELTSEVPTQLISLSTNPSYRYDEDKSESELEALLLADTMREFISYAVGCMLGRYSLDKPGLILANQGETAEDYRQQIPEPTFAPDEDNVIPMLDGDWFTDDISDRFKEFLKVTFGTEHYEENLTFLENALYPENATGKKRKTIRHYFLNGFYDHHIKLYKKRPIYWLFSSPKGTFNALIYMHRYRPDTVSTVLQYLRDFRDKLAHRRDHQQMVADGGGSTTADKTKALKDVTVLKKQLKELEDYERDTLFPLAQKKLNIDLDDGVRHNYQLFGSALKKITGLAGKES